MSSSRSYLQPLAFNSNDDDDNRNLSGETVDEEEASGFFHASMSTSPDDLPPRMPAGIIAANDNALRTPPRVLSSASLIGEEFLNSSRIESNDDYLEESPEIQTPGSQITTPPSTTHPPTLSPPLLQNPETVSYASRASTNRPPRVPQVSMRYGTSASVGKPRQARAPINHRRHNSAGDASLLSALTDPSYNDTDAARSRRSAGTAVSLEQPILEPEADVSGMDIDVPLSLQQPVLTEDQWLAGLSQQQQQQYHQLAQDVLSVSDSSRASDILGRTPVPPTPTPSFLPQRRESTDYVEELPKSASTTLKALGEFETEAEETILKAIEQEVKQQDLNMLEDIPFESRDRFEPTQEDASSVSGERIGAGARSRRSTNLNLDWNKTMHRFLSYHREDGMDGKAEESLHAVSRLSTGDKYLKNAWNMMSAGRRRRSRNISDTANADEGLDGATPSTKDVGDASGDIGEDVEAGNRDADMVGAIRSRGSALKRLVARNARAMKTDWELFEDFVRPQEESLKRHFLFCLFWFVLPSTLTAALLFYALDNPPTGRWPGGVPPQSNGNSTSFADANYTEASASWWLIFLGVRQLITYSCARVLEMILVDFFATTNASFIRLVGPTGVMFLSQGKGFPLRLTLFGIIDFLLLFGAGKTAKHWLHWQDSLAIFSPENPAGDVTNRDFYRRVLISFIVCGLLTSAKRVWIGQHLGRRLYVRYHAALMRLTKRILVISEVALVTKSGVGSDDIDRFLFGVEDTRDAGSFSDDGLPPQGRRGTVSPNSSVLDIQDLLGSWEDPVEGDAVDEDVIEMGEVSTKDILMFRHACSKLNTKFPFTVAFGPAENRAQCIASSEKLYKRFQMKLKSKAILKFEELVTLVAGSASHANAKKRKNLARIFQPDVEGNVSPLDFVRAIDEVYKDLRFFTHAVSTSAQLDRAYERIIDVGCGIMLGIVILEVCGIDSLNLFLGLSSIIVAFAFMIGSASASYFEGILLVLVRRPFDVGDRIAVADVNGVSETTGSAGWIIESIDLFTTTMRFGATNEIATVSNGSLARSRIINMQRSKNALVLMTLKFGVNVPYSKVKVFRGAVARFIAERPREWKVMAGFRSTRVESDLGYIEYLLIVQHTKAWQKVAEVLQSKADLASFCLELEKKLGMRYTAPPLPVNLSSNKGAGDLDKMAESPVTQDQNFDALAEMFETKKRR